MMGMVMPLIGFRIAYDKDVKISPELTRKIDALVATPPDHSRSRSVSDRSLEAAPAATDKGVVLGTVKTVGSLAVRPAAPRKSVMSAGTISVWPITAMVTPFPVFPAWYRGFTS